VKFLTFKSHKRVDKRIHFFVRGDARTTIYRAAFIQRSTKQVRQLRFSTGNTVNDSIKNPGPRSHFQELQVESKNLLTYT
jgi:hypothetical protein